VISIIVLCSSVSFFGDIDSLSENLTNKIIPYAAQGYKPSGGAVLNKEYLCQTLYKEDNKTQ